MKMSRLYRLFTELAGVLLIILFVYAAVNQVMQLSLFRSSLEKFPQLQSLAAPLSVVLPIAELGTGLLLVFPASRQKGLLFSSGLLALINVYLLSVVLFSPQLPCSCAGLLPALNWPQHIVFNFFFLALAFTGWHFSRSEQLLTAIQKKPCRPFTNLQA